MASRHCLYRTAQYVANGRKWHFVRHSPASSSFLNAATGGTQLVLTRLIISTKYLESGSSARLLVTTPQTRRHLRTLLTSHLSTQPHLALLARILFTVRGRSYLRPRHSALSNCCRGGNGKQLSLGCPVPALLLASAALGLLVLLNSHFAGAGSLDRCTASSLPGGTKSHRLLLESRLTR